MYAVQMFTVVSLHRDRVVSLCQSSDGAAVNRALIGRVNKRVRQLIAVCRDTLQEIVLDRSISVGEPSIRGPPEAPTTRGMNRVMEDLRHKPERAVVWPVHESDLEDDLLPLEDMPGTKELLELEDLEDDLLLLEDMPGTKEVRELGEELLELEEELTEIEESPPWLFLTSAVIFALIYVYTIISCINALKKRIIRGWNSNKKLRKKKRHNRRRYKAKT
uniref:uncharacterized protein n=1 Tax=Myxine glutinosa TaxID=7769 RepID=UPI00359011D3